MKLLDVVFILNKVLYKVSEFTDIINIRKEKSYEV